MFRAITTILIFISIYISSYIFFREPFEAYVSYVVFLIYFPFFFMRFGIPKYPVLLFLPLLVAGVTYCAMGLNTYQQFFKIFIGFFSSVLFYHYVIQLYNFDLKKLYRYYLIGSYIISLIGIFQVISYNVGFTPGYDFHWVFNKWGVIRGGFGIRMNSVFGEPAYFAAVIAPAFFTSVYNISVRKPIFITRRQSIVIACAYLLTFSSLGIGAIFLTVVLLMFNWGVVKYSLFFIPLIIFIFNYSYKNVPEFQDRWDGTFEVFGTGNYKSYDINGSSFVLYNNYHVATTNIMHHPLFGTGLGSHPTAFDKYSLTNLAGAVDIDFNKMDANSMFLRLMSETGLYGLSVMMLLLFKCWVFRHMTSDREIWVMSNSLVLIIILFLARQGHYFLNGFPFFLWLYYYTYKMNRGEVVVTDESAEPETNQFVASTLPNPSVPRQI